MTMSLPALRGSDGDRAAAPNSSTTRPASRLRALDGIRLLAALMVALYPFCHGST
jgi:hypothetical protein